MKKLSFILILLIPLIVFGQRTFKDGLIIEDSLRIEGFARIIDSLISEGIAKFNGGMYIGDSTAGSYVRKVDSFVISLTDTGFYSYGDFFPISTLGGGVYLLISDTATMLVPYINRSDTASMLTPYVNRSDTAAMLTPYINRADTASMLSPYLLSGDIAGKLDIADTAAMLLTYIDRSDTSVMLVPYINRADTAAMLTTYIDRSDTAAMLTPYGLLSETILPADTAAMLVPYINRADTAAMLTPYALLSEAGSAYNSGSGITIDGSNNIDLGGALDAPTTITGTEVNDFNISMTDAGDRSGILGFDAANWWLSMRAYTGDDHTGDSGVVSVDSSIVFIAQYNAGTEKSIKMDTSTTSGIIITDHITGAGMQYAADYSIGYTERTPPDKGYVDSKLGGQALNSTISSPTGAEHGDVITWDSLNSQYVATDVVPVSQAAGLVIEAFDTIIFSLTAVDTIVILPVGAVIWDIQVYLNTTFDGSGTNLLDAGIDGDGDKYINDFDLENPTATFYGLGAIPDRMAATTEIIFQYTDSGADAGAGLAFIYVKYSIPAKLY